LRTTKSLCPECLDVIDASIIEEKGKIMLEKTCNKHGFFKDVYWSSAEQFERMNHYMHDGGGITNQNVSSNGDCPASCGLCASHKTTTLLANIDVTNRCNQNCPVCFANASVSGYLYEPSLDRIRAMIQVLRDEKPVPCPAVQFSGGEPTMRNDIIQIIKIAREFKIGQIQMATNGIKLAESLKFCKDLETAGLNTVYLQFDGVTAQPYMITRGYNALPLKLKAIENCRAANLESVFLVPTLAKGVNDDQVGDIIRFASDNRGAVEGINFQPISFAGRVNKEERLEKRVTIPDLFRQVEEQTDGAITAEDFYPVPLVVPISRFITALGGAPHAELTVHPHCGAGTYVIVEEGRVTPLTRFVDVEGLVEHINELGQEKYRWTGKTLSKIKRMVSLISVLPKYIDMGKAPRSVDIKKLIFNVLTKGTGEAIREFNKHTLFIGAMHFMDLYNIDLERIKRCGVHYATPDGRIIPFCTYNTIYRAEVERKFAKPLLKEDVRS
jgi:uncharacterized radical SAM superfamily Fe-S cluster-containing enzyme